MDDEKRYPDLVLMNVILKLQLSFHAKMDTLSTSSIEGLTKNQEFVSQHIKYQLLKAKTKKEQTVHTSCFSSNELNC